jgi:hypothetical protein
MLILLSPVSNRSRPLGTTFTAAILLLIISASRVLRLAQLGMNPDEIWSVWQTFGTPGQILLWTPYDWPPGYYLTLGLWRGLTGQHPIVLRYLSMLAFLIGCSFLFRIVKRLHGSNAALLAMPAYAALGYSILLSTEVQGYALLLGLLPIALWLTISYFENPSTKRAVLLAVSIAAMFYVSVTSIGAFLMLGIYTLVVHQKQIWRWWLPGLIAGLITMPEIISKSHLAITSTEVTRTLILPPLIEAVRNVYLGYVGYERTFLLWTILFISGTGLIFLRHRAKKVALVWLLWIVGAPILMYMLHPLLTFFSVRNAWWILLGIAVWIALGLTYLPRRLMTPTLILLSAMTFMPILLQDYTPLTALSPLEANFIWLEDHLATGDVFVADEGMECGAAEEWDYFTRTYFPYSLTFVQYPTGYRRIWYVTGNAQPDQQQQQAVMNGRIAGRFVGPAQCLFRLFEAPPDSEGILFENGMRFHGVDVMDGERPWTAPLVKREGETVRVRLWWSVDRVPDLDYSIGTYIMRGNDLLGQFDGPPQVVYPETAPQETSRWQLGQYYIEDRELALPFPTPRSNYRILMSIYFWQDGRRVRANGMDEKLLLTLKTFTVMSY